MAEAYAHTAVDRPWEPLKDHLTAVSELAAKFGEAFDAGEWAALAGLWHDLGKYSNEFQAYLRTTAKTDADTHTAELAGRVDHSSAGAQWAKQKCPNLGMVLAHVIAGHHAGLLDYSREAGAACLQHRLTKDLLPWREGAPEHLLASKLPAAPVFKSPDSLQHAAFRVAFWIRMLFSALVDADFLATEAFMAPDKTTLRSDRGPALSDLKCALDDHLESLTKEAIESEVNRQRARVLSACRMRASESPGFFELCVPTGGGKTLSSLAFAIDHAIEHCLRRVIVAVPFTSIIEQNAQRYRDAFSAISTDVVLEHHSNLDPRKETDRNRLQSENWDAPVVVTTNVQFFESLFACRTSRCRKLHRIARSVIVLDEVQALPVDLLKPTLWALRELVDNYDCTVVLSSATQPALARRDGFAIGLQGIRQIVAESRDLYESMRRTEVRVEDRLIDEDLLERLLKHEQVLCIVNTRAHAARLAEMLGHEENHFHLSTRMCGAHRLDTLHAIGTRLENKEGCRVVSTQLVEAGVDLDFPAVYRARCGLDSLAQAAGRCNREGLIKSGEVIFFSADKLPPVGYLRQTAQRAEELLGQYQDDLLAPEAIEAYFRLHYWLSNDRWDHRNVLEEIGSKPDTMRFQFAEIARKYRFIQDQGSPLLIPWCVEGQKLAQVLRGSSALNRVDLRAMQRYCVQVRDHELCRLQEAGAVELVRERWVLTSTKHYDKRLGLVLDRAWEAEDLVV